jgi:hypothetical protein
MLGDGQVRFLGGPGRSNAPRPIRQERALTAVLSAVAWLLLAPGNARMFEHSFATVPEA